MKVTDKPRVLRENFFMLAQIWRFSPGLVLSKFICTALTAGEAAFIVVSNAEILRMLERGESFAAFLPLFALRGILILLANLASRVCALYLFPKYTNKLQCGLTESLFQKAVECDLADFDDPTFFSTLDQAVRQTLKMAGDPLDTLTRFLRFLVTFGAGCAMIFSVSPLIFLLALSGSVCEFFISRRRVKIQAEKDFAQTPSRRKADYVRRIFFLDEYAGELRATPGYGKLLLRDYEEAEKEGLRIHLRAEKRLWGWFLLSLGSEEVQLLFSTLAVTAGYFSGSLGLADFSVVAVNLGAVQRLLTVFGDIWNKFVKHALYIRRYRAFCERQPKVKSGSLPPPETFEKIEFRNVSFRYGEEESSPLRLKNLNLTIRRGEKIALVGENGAGKTTFVKLLLRFYDPTEGSIFLDGVNIKNFDLPAYRQKIGALFQDFRLFPATIAENVLGGEAAEKDFPKVKAALTAAGLWEKVERLPEGVRSQVTKEFDKAGVQLSGGEGQKLALARAFAAVNDSASPALFTVLDEPSSALDPLAEAALNRAVMEILREETILFISHRLTTVREADRICLFAEGHVVEEGSHDALMKQGGNYAALFNLQGERYNSRADFSTVG